MKKMWEKKLIKPIMQYLQREYIEWSKINPPEFILTGLQKKIKQLKKRQEKGLDWCWVEFAPWRQPPKIKLTENGEIDWKGG